VWLSIHSGVPTDSDRVFCTSGAVNQTCYFYNHVWLSRDNAQRACEGRGGWLVAYNSAEEQLEVETYFSGGCAGVAYDASTC
jgi:hypothetical protein